MRKTESRSGVEVAIEFHPLNAQLSTDIDTTTTTLVDCDQNKLIRGNTGNQERQMEMADVMKARE